MADAGLRAVRDRVEAMPRLDAERERLLLDALRLAGSDYAERPERLRSVEATTTGGSS